MTSQSAIENEFQLNEGIYYLNHAAVAPWPERTRQAVEKFATENTQQGSQNYPEWIKTESRLRIQLAELIHASSADDIALLKSTSEALSVVAYGLDWQSGDNVVISNEEFPSNRIVWESLQSKGVDIKQIDLHSGTSPEQALMEACDSNTRLLSISSVQYASGFRVDLEPLGKYCRAQDILFCVDAIQSIGAVDFNVEAIQADFVMADGHKWMLGPEGLALFYTSANARDKLKLNQFGWHMVEHYGEFSRKEWEPAHSARRFECGSPNMLGTHALQASISLLLEVGMTEVEKHVLSNTEFMHEQVKKSENLESLTDMASGRYAGILVFWHKQANSTDLYQYLMKQGVMCAERGGGIRFSPHFYTDRNTIIEAIHMADAYTG